MRTAPVVTILSVVQLRKGKCGDHFIALVCSEQSALVRVVRVRELPFPQF